MSEHQKSQDSYLLTGRGEILERLRLMQRHKILLSATPGGQTSGFMTTIVKVIPDKGLLAIDATNSDSLNASITNARSVTFDAQVEGVEARFSATGISEARLDGNSVFAVPIPNSLYWLQRRTFFRVSVPLSWQMKCRIPMSGDKVGEFEVLDLSLGGLAIHDRANLFREHKEKGTHFANCSLLASGIKDEMFGLDLRYIFEIKGMEGRSETWRLGFAFSDFTRNFQVHLQKLVYELELQRKEAEKRIRD